MNAPSRKSGVRGDEELPDVRPLDLRPHESRVLLKACKAYRAALPSYLRAVRDEVEAMDRIIDELSGG